MSIAQRLVNFSDGLSADGVLSAAKGGTGTTTGAGSSTPTISTINYGGDDTATNPAGGATITLTGTNFAAGAKVLINTTPVGVVTVVSATQITFTAPALSAGSYILYVVNLDGSTAIAVPGIQYSGTPAWTTAAGSLGTGYETGAVATTVAATSDSAVSYSVVGGTLPSGVTINASGTISGTSPLVAGSTTYTFTVRATDLELQDTDRQFSLTINPDVVTWSSPVNNATLTGTPGVAYTSNLAAASAAGQTVSYTADSLPAGLTLSGSTISGTPTTPGASATTLTATSAVTNKTAQIAISWTINIASDTYFKYTTLLLNSETAAQPFLADASTNNFALTAFGDTKPNNFNPYTPGYYSVQFNGTSDYLTIPHNDNLVLALYGGFSVECWVYMTSLTAGQYIWNKNGVNGSKYPSVGLQWNGTTFRLVYGNSTGLSTVEYINFNTIPNILNNWVHIATQINGSTIQSWVNGAYQPDTYILQNPPVDNGQPFYIGGQSGATSNATGLFSGYISNLRVITGGTYYDGSTAARNLPPVPASPVQAVSINSYYFASGETQLVACNSARFMDLSSNNHTVNRVGAPKVSGFDPYTPNSSYSTRGSTYFDGTGDYLGLPSSSAFSMGTGDFTIEAWIYTTSSGTQRIVSSTGNNFEFVLVNTGGNVYLNWYDGVVDTASGTNYVPQNSWAHVAVSRSGTSLRLFINGVISGSSTNSVNLPANPTLYVGIYGQSNINAFTGYISDLRFVKGTALYTANFTPPTAPLTAVTNTSLLTLQTNQPHTNNTFLDNSSNALAITRTGNTTQGSFSPYGANWSNYFDGTGQAFYSTSVFSGANFGTGDFTIEMWAMWTSAATANNTIFELTGTTRLIFGRTTTGIRLHIANNGPERGYATTIPLNTWNHLAIVKNSGTIKVYLNGVSGTSFADSTNWATTTFYLSRNSDGAEVSSAYYMSNLRVVKGTAVYTANFTPPTSPLTAIAGTTLLTCQSPSFVDNSPDAYALTILGTPSTQKFSPFSLVTQTPITHSVGFDGTGDYLTLPSSSNLVLGSGDFCVEMWYYQQANAFAALFSNAVSSGGGDAQFEIQIASSTFYPTLMGWATAFLTSNVASTPNAWNHIAVCRSGTTLSMFLNGTRVATTTTSNNFSSTNSFHISRQAAGAAAYINGYISNLRVVKGSSVYTPSATTIAVPTQPLTAVANTQLLTCQSSTLIDNSVNQFAITAVGDAKPRRFNPFGSTTSSAQDYTPAVFGSSAYFDGSGNDYLSIANSTNLNLNSNDFTIESWWYPIASSDQNIIAKWWTGGNQWVVQWRGAGYFRFAVNSSTLSDFSVTLPLNSWCHFAFVRRGTSLNFYFNGVKHSAVGTLGSITATTDITTIGQFANSGTENLSGYLSDMRVVIGSALYLNSFTPPVAPLTAVPNTTLLLNMDKSAVQDKSGKVVLETVGDAKVSTAVKKYGTSSLYFDGTGDGLQLPITPQVYLGTTYTIEAWIYSAGGLYYQAIFELCENNTGGFAGLDLIKVGTTIAASVRTTTLGTPVAITGGTLVTNTWQHVALSVNAGSAKLFLDGIQIGSTTTFPEFPIAKTLFAAVGRFANGYTAADTNSWNGYIDDLRITRGYARYTANFTPPAQALLTK